MCVPSHARNGVEGVLFLKYVEKEMKTELRTLTVIFLLLTLTWS